MHAKCKLLGCYTYVGLTRFKVNELQKYDVTKTSILFFSHGTSCFCFGAMSRNVCSESGK